MRLLYDGKKVREERTTQNTELSLVYVRGARFGFFPALIGRR